MPGQQTYNWLSCCAVARLPLSGLVLYACNAGSVHRLSTFTQPR